MDIVLLHGFVKKSNKTPTKELELAKKFMLLLRWINMSIKGRIALHNAVYSIQG
jgi:hypothetical protein